MDSFPAAAPPSYLSGAPQPAGAPLSYKPMRPKRGGKPWWSSPLVIAGGGTAASLLLLGILGFALWNFGGDLISWDAWSRPTFDSTLARMESLGKQHVAAIESIENEDDHQRVLPRLESLNEQLWLTAVRSGQIRPIAGEWLDRHLEQKKAENEAALKDKEREPSPVDRLREKGLWSQELEKVHRESQLLSMRIAAFVTFGTRQLREPEDDVERLEHDNIELLRRYVARLAQIKSQRDLARAAPAIERLADELYELAYQRKGLTEGWPEIARDYVPVLKSLEAHRELQEGWFKRTYEPELEFAVALADFAAAEIAFSRASWNQQIAARDREKLRQREQERIAKEQAPPPVERVARAAPPPEEPEEPVKEPEPPAPPAADSPTDAGAERSSDAATSDDAGGSGAGEAGADAPDDRSPRPAFPRSGGFRGRGFSGPGSYGGPGGYSGPGGYRGPERGGFEGRIGGGASDPPTGGSGTPGSVIIEILGGANLPGAALTKRFADALRVNSAFSASGGKARLSIHYGGELERVVELIDFGTVTKVDETNRTIHVTVE